MTVMRTTTKTTTMFPTSNWDYGDYGGITVTGITGDYGNYGDGITVTVGITATPH